MGRAQRQALRHQPLHGRRRVCALVCGPVRSAVERLLPEHGHGTRRQLLAHAGAAAVDGPSCRRAATGVRGPLQLQLAPPPLLEAVVDREAADASDVHGLRPHTVACGRLRTASHRLRWRATANDLDRRLRRRRVPTSAVLLPDALGDDPHLLERHGAVAGTAALARAERGGADVDLLHSLLDAIVRVRLQLRLLVLAVIVSERLSAVRHLGDEREQAVRIWLVQIAVALRLPRVHLGDVVRARRVRSPHGRILS